MAAENKACCVPGRTRNPAIQAEVIQESACSPETDDMVYVSGGTFLMGTEDEAGFPADGEGPVREVSIDPFYVDPHPVTNAEFSTFIRETGYVTEAERFNWSFVFEGLLSPREAKKIRRRLSGAPWWCPVQKACWKWPEGSGSHISDRMNHPVVHVSWNDATAYCRWRGVRLLSEPEWEFAARGGLSQKTYPWGDELTPNGVHQCNIWQGTFPSHNTREDGFMGTSPVGSFPPNAYGVYDVAGNVWEWCRDPFAVNSSVSASKKLEKDAATHMKAIRGGSYLCHASYCNRYRVAARSANTADSSTGNLGFRCGVSA